MQERPPLYGLMAEFEHSEELLEAARQANQEGYLKMDAYSPMHIEGLTNVLRPQNKSRRDLIPPLMLLGGILGGLPFMTGASTTAGAA